MKQFTAVLLAVSMIVTLVTGSLMSADAYSDDSSIVGTKGESSTSSAALSKVPSIPRRSLRRDLCQKQMLHAISQIVSAVLRLTAV